METGTYLTGSSTFSADQSTPSTFTVGTNATSLNTPSTLMARDASGSVVVNQLSYTSLSPAIPSANDGLLTMETGTYLSGSATFSADQSASSTFSISTNGTPDATPSTLVARDASGNFSVNELSYSSLNPPISGGGDLTVVDVDSVPPPPVPEVEKWTIQSPVVVSYVGYYSIGTNLRGATYNNDGSRLYTVETTTDRVRQYSLSSPYLVSTAVLEATVSLGTSTRGLDFRPDGTYFATIRNISADACVVYECVAGPWDITGAVQRSSFNINTSGLIAGPQSVSWVGNERIFIGDINGEISTFLFNQGSKTISYVASTNLDTGDNIGGISFKENGTKMFKLLQTGIIQEYDLSVAYSYTVANRTLLSTTYDVINGVPAIDRPNAIVEWDIKFSNALGNNIIVSDGANGRIYQFSLAFPAGPAPLHYTYPIFVNSTSGVQEDILVDNLLTYETTTKTLEVGTLKYTTLDPAISGSANDPTITFSTTSPLTGSGSISLNQSTAETLTFGLDVQSLNIPASANDGLLSMETGTYLTGSSTFSADQSAPSTFTVATNATSLNTPSTLVARDANGDISVGQLSYTSLSPPISGSANDPTITFNTTSPLTGSGTITLNQSASETLTFGLNVPSLNIPASANDGLLSMETGTYLTGSSTFSADQSTPSTFTVATNATSLATPSTLVARDASGDISVGQLSYTSLSPAIPSANDGLLTMETGTYLSGSSTFSADQSTPSTFSISTNATSLNSASTLVARDEAGGISVGQLSYTSLSPAIPSANDGLLTMETGTYLSGSATFSADQSTPSTFTVATNATNLNTPYTLMARDASGGVSVGELSYTSLNPPISIPSPTDIFVSEDYTTNDFLPIVFASPPAFDGVKTLRHNNTDGFGYNPQLAMLVSPTTTISTYLSAPTDNLTTGTTSGNGSVCLSSGTGIARSSTLSYDSATNTLNCNITGTSSGGGGGSGEADTIKVGYDNTDTVAYLTFVNSSSTSTYQQLEMNYSIYADTTTGSIRANKIRNSLGRTGLYKVV
jgi:trimeric autotransporter adhesin